MNQRNHTLRLSEGNIHTRTFTTATPTHTTTNHYLHSKEYIYLHIYIYLLILINLPQSKLTRCSWDANDDSPGLQIESDSDPMDTLTVSSWHARHHRLLPRFQRQSNKFRSNRHHFSIIIMVRCSISVGERVEIRSRNSINFGSRGTVVKLTAKRVCVAVDPDIDTPFDQRERIYVLPKNLRVLDSDEYDTDDYPQPYEEYDPVAYVWTYTKNPITTLTLSLYRNLPTPRNFMRSLCHYAFNFLKTFKNLFCDTPETSALARLVHKRGITDGNRNHRMETDNGRYVIREDDIDDGQNWEHIGDYRNTSPINWTHR